MSKQLVFGELMNYILSKESGSKLKRDLKQALDKKHFYITLKKKKGTYIMKKDSMGHFSVTDRLLRFLIVEMYNSMLEDSTLESVAEFVGLINSKLEEIGYLYLILTSVKVKGGIAANVGILIDRDIVSTIHYKNREMLYTDEKKEGEYTLISIDTADMNESEAGNCVGGGWCSYFWDVKSPKKKYKKDERIVFEVDGKIYADVTVGHLEDISEQYYTDKKNKDESSWEIGLDTTGYDEDIEDEEEKNWYVKGNYVYVKNFAIAHNYKYR